MQSKEKNMDLTSTENEAAKKAKKADKWADKPAMEVRDLHFSYGKNKVLKGVSLKIEEGKITTIMGANGCGKSTLFSLMTKDLYPGKGNIFLKGKNIQNLNLKEFARKVAIVQQYNSASDDITVENLVAFGRTPHKKMMQGDSAEDERYDRMGTGSHEPDGIPGQGSIKAFRWTAPESMDRHGTLSGDKDAVP